MGTSLPIAGMAQKAFSTYSGVVLDPQDGFLPNAKVILTNTQTTMKNEMRADSMGRFEFVGLPPADYALEAVLPGFANLRGTLTVTGEDLQRDIRLNVGSLEETITVTDGPRVSRPLEPPRPKRPLPTCTAASFAGRPGGKIRPPHKILDVRPIYPSGMQDAKPEETVLLDATIATDGTVKEVDVRGIAHPAFAASAIEAVRQWQFDETILNCVPVEVAMNVTVTFKRLQ
jgi:TonB family protein